MTEATPAPVVAEPTEAAEPAPVTGTQSPGASAAPAATAPGAWPDVSIATAGPRCPWCSAPLASLELETCPSCGAQLNAPTEADVPGVTTIDVAALAWKAGTPPRRNRLLSWISGEDDSVPDTSGASPSAVEPPSVAVRREMLRLELEAEGINVPHDAEPSGAEEAAAVAEGDEAASSSGGPGPDAPAVGTPSA
jgi:hypothetical protein